MAKIAISIDTEAKSLALTIDGTTIPDAEDVSVYTYRDSNGNVSSLDISISTTTQEENGVSKRVSYHAYGSKEAERALATGHKVYNNVKGFVGVDDLVRAAMDIDEFLSSQKRGL